MNNLVIKAEKTAMNVKRESESARYLLNLVKEKNKASVLDYGCGLGRNINYLLNNADNIVVDGCDTEEQVKNISKDEKKMRFLLGKNTTITTSIQLKKQYDFILSSHVLNVVLDDVKLYILEDMYKKLKKDGRAIIQVRTAADVESAKSKKKFASGWLIQKGKDKTFQEGISKEKMENLLIQVGFKIVNHKFTKSIHMVEVTK